MWKHNRMAVGQGPPNVSLAVHSPKPWPVTGVFAGMLTSPFFGRWELNHGHSRCLSLTEITSINHQQLSPGWTIFARQYSNNNSPLPMLPTNVTNQCYQCYQPYQPYQPPLPQQLNPSPQPQKQRPTTVPTPKQLIALANQLRRHGPDEDGALPISTRVNRTWGLFESMDLHMKWSIKPKTPVISLEIWSVWEKNGSPMIFCSLAVHSVRFFFVIILFCSARLQTVVPCWSIWFHSWRYSCLFSSVLFVLILVCSVPSILFYRIAFCAVLL